MHYPVAMLLLLLLLGSVAGGQTNDDDAYLHCIERGECGLASVCSFELRADPMRCDPTATNPRASCRNLTGHIMSARNGLGDDVALRWDAPGATPVNGSVPSGDLWIGAKTRRFFDTGLAGPHTVRLRDGLETLDTTIADWHTMCTPNDACQYLLRTCFDQQSHRCTEYARHCGGFADDAEETARRHRCIPNCISTFYTPVFGGIDPYTAIDSDALVQGIAWSLGNGTNVSALLLSGHAPDGAGGGGGTIAILAILVTLSLAVNGGFIYMRYFHNNDIDTGTGRSLFVGDDGYGY